MKKVTIWEKFYEPSKDSPAHYKFNHLGEDWCQVDKPRNANKSVDSGWSKSQWRKSFAYMNESNQVLRVELIKGEF